jgi:ferredoxin-nitrite reductase
MTTAATPPTLNKFEKFKAEKDGLAVKTEVAEFARIGWEAMDETDREHRLKWLGVFWRPVTPGKFMMRFRIPHGITNSAQLRCLGEIIQRYGDGGTADITTRQNFQLRGILIEDLPEIFAKMSAVGLTSVQSGMDNVRNLTGSPVAGIEKDELYDTRALIQELQDRITNGGEGNPEFTNLPRKFNIAIEGSRDNSVHAEINDLAFVPAFKDDVFGFNIVVGGFFSGKRAEAAMPLNAWLAPEEVVEFSLTMLRVFRDNGLRANRTKARLMYLIDEWGIDKFRSEMETAWGKPLATAAPKDEMEWEKRDHIGVHPQKQAGLNYVGLHIPVGKLGAADFFEIARLGEVYGTGEVRITVEQNVIIPHVSDSKLNALLAEPLLGQFSPNPGALSRTVVSCTGAQFCGFALIETKQYALSVISAVEAKVSLSQPVRIHWTGCPNSCGQPQVADIGLMGSKGRKDGKTVDAVDIFTGGKVGKDAKLGEKVMKGIPIVDLEDVLIDLLVNNFGAQANR